MHNHYTQNALGRNRPGPRYNLRDVRFEFFRLRFYFEAVNRICFSPGSSSNIVRGAFGGILREIACTKGCGPDRHAAGCRYARIFEPRTVDGHRPSGLADWPRPFVFRTRHLDGRAFDPLGAFCFDVHLFNVREPEVSYFVAALARLATDGIGPGRGRARLTAVDQLPADDNLGAFTRVWTGQDVVRGLQPSAIELAPAPAAINRVRVRFLTPTELKTGSSLAEQPDFPVLFARIRDRLSTLSALYGAGPLELDFRAMGRRAAEIETTDCELHMENVERHSTRTGQVHSLGGFTGEAEYRGTLGEFLPFMRAARWTGVGRQTVWGKGEIEIVEPVSRL